MGMKNNMNEDIIKFTGNFELSDCLSNSSFLITGATGLIGSVLVKCLLALNKDISITIPVRDLTKAQFIFKDYANQLKIVECDLTDYVGHLEEHFDYIIHLASPTSGKYFIEHPAETYQLAIDSTERILNYARKQPIRGFVYASSLEIYGENSDDSPISELFRGYIDYSSSRSSYPLGKRAAEYLCFAYAKEYSIPVKVARLTQTFGAGVSSKDDRVFAQFARSVISGSDIILHTKGESAKPYCYTTDCISALLYILLKGEAGEAYNVANPDTYISIYDMAMFLKEKFNPSINIVIEEHPELGYAPVTKLKLTTDKLMSLGWKPKYSLIEMFNNLIDSLKYETYK